MKRSVVISLIFIMFAASSFAQDFTLAISYLSGEKSKDSHSTRENIAINGTSAAYSVKYFGRKGENQQDNNKTCTLSEEDVLEIRAVIVKKGLNKTDSLFSESSKSKSYEVYTNISISMTLDGQEYKIKINGDTNEFNDAKLYKSSLLLITRIRNMIENCK